MKMYVIILLVYFKYASDSNLSLVLIIKASTKGAEFSLSVLKVKSMVGSLLFHDV